MNIQSIHFIDIETVPQHENIHNGVNTDLFYKKFGDRVNNSDSPEEFYKESAGMSAEFGKVVCVSIGKMAGEKFFIKSFISENESELLSTLALYFETGKHKPQVIAGHNIIEFDIPFLFRRLLVNGISLPAILNNYDRKPWETPYRDTMKMWSSTQWNYKVSLNLIAELFGLPSPKENMEGKDVADLFYSSDPEKLSKISKYCSGDVFTTANVYCKMTGQPLILETQIERV